METIKDRLVSFIEYKGMTMAGFENVCGLSRNYIGKINNVIGSDVLEKIIRHNSDLNVYWLITGEGEMDRYKAVEMLVRRFITIENPTAELITDLNQAEASNIYNNRQSVDKIETQK